eukprot:TRINITY_DN6388_c0_g1_i1.p1 TRINITY_DN6388_c0_g1~~TRINITY_DN6388_c0_g1_i1.p1  ORF type:complete len:170 (+),score=30.13 TRINITY_DN6388_c0_g1_i1:76-510(+)
MCIRDRFYVPAEFVQEQQNDEVVATYENSVLFYITNFQFIASCFAFSVSKPFREAFYRNKSFTFVSLIIIFYCTWLLVRPDALSLDFFEIMELPLVYRMLLCSWIVANFLWIILWDSVLVSKFTFWWRVERRKKRKRYLNPNLE